MALRTFNTSSLLTTPQFKSQWLYCGVTFDSLLGQQVRHASLIKRPYRPYTFTQLIVLSDGSTFTLRTTSPAPVYKSTKDSRNHPLWQPSSAALRNVETDEAGRLRAFRKRFGHNWDADEKELEPKKKTNNIKIRNRSGDAKDSSEKEKVRLQPSKQSVATDSMMDLISNAAAVSTSKTASGRRNQDILLEEKARESLVTEKGTPGKYTKVEVKNPELSRKEQENSKS